MQVQPIFPEPITHPGCAEEQPYRVRVAFIRRVLVGHAVTVAFIAALVVGVPEWEPLRVGSGALGVLLTLSLVRLLRLGETTDRLLSGMLLVPLLVLLAGLAKVLPGLGFPVWALGWSVAGGLLYTLACGDNFSFLGAYTLGGLGGMIGAIATAVMGREQPLEIAAAAGLVAIFLAYLLYDLACLLRRRKVTETISAVADLYRDVLNFMTYPILVVRHWQGLRS